MPNIKADGVVILQNNIKAVLGALDSQVAAALEEVGMRAETNAKRLCPVDTGRLRNSITHTSDGKDAYIGTNVEYAGVVEFGYAPMNRTAKPFLRPAAQEHVSEYSAVFKKHLGS